MFECARRKYRTPYKISKFQIVIIIKSVINVLDTIEPGCPVLLNNADKKYWQKSTRRPQSRSPKPEVALK